MPVQVVPLVHVAHVALQLETGGMERLLVEFARRADRSRFALHFVSLGRRGPVADEIEACGWPVTALETAPGVHPGTVIRLARLFRAQRTGIVHTHNTKPLLYAGPAARIAGVPCVVHTRHGQRHGASSRQTMLFRLAARCADRMVCVSQDCARLCMRDGMAAARVRTIWNGIDRERFSLPPAGVHSVADRPAVYVGRLTREKDTATLLRASVEVIARCPSFRLAIAGSGPCAAELVDLAHDLGIAEHVRFLGEVRDIAGLLHSASLFVLPSLTEGIPLTVLEAMACGLPVVATRVGGVPEAVTDGTTGVIVEPGHVAELAAALLHVYQHPATARDMGRAGHERVRQFFDVRTMVSGYESLYDDVLSGAAARAA